MDKELPKSNLQLTPGKVLIRVSQSNLPGASHCYTGSLPFRPTLDMEDIAKRIVAKRSEFRKETLLTVFHLMKDELYCAIEDGFNVDFDFGRTEITVNGNFDSIGDKFDRKRHTLTPCLRPSPQLKQRTARIPVENASHSLFANTPHPAYVSLAIYPRTADSTEPFNQIPAGRHPFVSIYGNRLTLVGDLPDVGIRLRCLDTGVEQFFPPEAVIINSLSRLCFSTDIDFSAGMWEVVVGSQFNPSYRPYKQTRYGTLTFTVV